MKDTEKNKEDSDIINNSFIEALKKAKHFFDRAVVMENTMVTYGLSQNEYAIRIGRSQSFVSNTLRLLQLSSRVRRSVKENRIPERHARALVELNEESKQLEMIKLIKKERFSAVETEIIVKGGMDYVDKVRTMKSNRKKQECLEGLEAYYEYERMLALKNRKEKALADESVDPKVIKKIVLSSDESKEITVKNIKLVKALLKNLDKLLLKAEQDGIIIQRTMTDDYEKILYEITIPKRDNLLWK